MSGFCMVARTIRPNRVKRSTSHSPATITAATAITNTE